MRTTMILTGAVALAFSLSLAETQAAQKARSPASIECSKQADAKGLHGKARKKFRSACKRRLTKT